MKILSYCSYMTALVFELRQSFIIICPKIYYIDLEIIYSAVHTDVHYISNTSAYILIYTQGY